MARTHWSAPDVSSDILAEALRPDAAPPVAIHIRPEIRAHLCVQAADRLNGIPLVVDDRIPSHPGYEIHRAAAPGVIRGVGNRFDAPASSPAAAAPLAA